MKKRFLILFFVLLVIVGVAKEKAPFIMADNSTALTNAQADKARLEAELEKLEKEIAAKQKELDGQKGQSVSISRDIAVLSAQIEKSKLDIKSSLQRETADRQSLCR